MYRDRDVVAKGEVVEHIDSKEHQGTCKQPSQRNSASLKEQRWSAGGEVSWPCEESCYDELDESDQETLYTCQCKPNASRARQGLTYRSLAPI